MHPGHTSKLQEEVFLKALRKILMGLLAAAAAALAVAQTPPGSALPGRVERDVTPEPQPPLRDAVINIDRARYPEQLPERAQDTRFVLRGVTLTGNRAITTAELEPLWAAQLGSQVTVAEAFAIAEAITARYRERGYILSQAIVQPQDLRTLGANFEIRVVEGFVNAITVSGPSGLGERLAPLLEPIRLDRPLRLQTLERYLLLLNTKGGLSANASLRPSSVEGAADLVVQVTQDKQAFSASATNRGTKALGEARLDALVDLRDVFGALDRQILRVQSSGDERLWFVSYNGEWPVGREGFKAGLAASVSRSKPEGTFDLDTRSDNLTLSSSYPFALARRYSVTSRVSLNAYNNGSDVSSLGVTRDRIRALRIGLAGDYADDLGGINLLDLEVSKGLSGLGASSPGDALSRAEADPQFVKTTVYLARLQHIVGDFSALFAVSAQDSKDTLVTAEQFGLGGEAFLRAFDSSEVLGDRGAAGKFELRWSVPAAAVNTTLYAFVDVGKVQRFVVGGGRESDTLRSTGLGIRASFRGLRGYLEAAKPYLRDPAATGDRDVRVFGVIGYDF